jgi:hypothetical protein
MSSKNPTNVDTHSPAAEDELDWQPRRKLGGPIFLALGFIAAALGVWYFVILDHPQPGRVVLWVQVPGASDAEETIAKAMVEELEELGLEVVPPIETEEALSEAESIEELRDATAGLQAGLLILATMEIAHDSEFPEMDGLDTDISLQIQVISTMGDEEPVSVFDPPFLVEAWGKRPSDLLERIAPAFTPMTLGPLAQSIASRAQFEGLAEGGSSNEEMTLAGRMEGLFKLSTRVRNATVAREQVLESARETHSEWVVQGSLQPVSPAYEYHYLREVADDGQLIMEAEAIQYRFDHGKGTLSRLEGRDQIRISNGDGSNLETVFQHANFFSDIDISSDGRYGAVIGDERGTAKVLLRVDLESGESSPVARSTQLPDGHKYLQDPSISPDGATLAVFESDCNGCSRDLVLYDQDGENRRKVFSEVQVWSGRHQWSSDSRSLYTVSSSLREHGSLWTIDVASGQATAVLGSEMDIRGQEGLINETQVRRQTERAEALAQASTEDFQYKPDPFDVIAADTQTSEFTSVNLVEGGSALVFIEHSGIQEYVGRFELSDGSYRRLAQGRFGNLVSTPQDHLALTWTRLNETKQSEWAWSIMDTEGNAQEPFLLSTKLGTLVGLSPDESWAYASMSDYDPDFDERAYQVFRIPVSP